MEQGVMVLKGRADKKGLRTLAYQVAQITTQATRNNIQIIDCIVTFGGAKDIIREVKNLDCEKRFDTILIYSPKQICKEKEEYENLVEVLEKEFKVGIKYYRF